VAARRRRYDVVMLPRRPPIHSRFEDDPDLDDDLSRFVVALGEIVDGLQDAGLHHDLGALKKHSVELAADARRFGYPPLEAAALGVQAAAERGEDDPIEHALIELTEVARCVRRGHRGGA
jgi:hypothetical protein